MRLIRKAGAAALILALSFAAAGCGGGSGDEAGGADRSASAPGVSADKIVLGNLTDLTGTWGPVGKMYLSGVQLWADTVNANGGVCNRKIELLIRDHKSNPQDAVSIYREMEPKVLAMTAVLGSGPVLAIAPSLEKDEMISSTYAWDEAILQASKNVFLPGSTYEVAIINDLDWAVKNIGIQKGDTIALVRYAGLFEGVKSGMEIVAKKYGLKFVEQTMQFTDSDFTGPVSTVQRANAKFVVVALSVAHTGGFAATAASKDYFPKLFSPSPGNFDVSLLDGPAKKPLEENMYFGSPFMSWDDPSPAAEAVRTAFKEHGEGEPNYGIMLGYGQGEAFGKLIQATCDSGELTRARLVETFRKTANLTTDGVMADLDLTRGDSKSQATKTRIFQPDSSVTTGLREVEGPYESPLVAENGL